MATPAVKAVLRSAFLDAHSTLDPPRIKGPIRGTTYYGAVGRREYALATFSMPDTGVTDQPEVFSRPPGGAWRDLGDTGGGYGGRIPAAPPKAWDLR